MKFKIKKKHIGIFFLIVIIILLVMGGIELKKAFYPNESTVIYGSRLDGRKELVISEEAKNKVKEKISDKTVKSNVRIAGRIIYITMTVKDGTSLDDAKKLGNLALECFSEKEKGYYDIQIMIAHEKNTTMFPIIGYKHHLKENIRWTKDRTDG